MSLNISVYYGVPTTLTGAKDQFNVLTKLENRPMNKGKWLALKKLTSGKYKGLWSTYLYDNKPKSKCIMMKRL